MTPTCPYCQQPSELVTGEAVYPFRQDLFSLNFYKCSPCNAYVGTHKGTTKALGRLANAELRKAKSAAHREFDIIWRSGHITRGLAYARLAKAMNLKQKDCHIGMFNVEQCEQVVEAVKQHLLDA